MYDHWFVSRQKRQLTTILQALVAFNDVCIGEKWAGNRELQLRFEDELGKREITKHGKLRDRKTGRGGGGTRTLYKQMKDLGLIFTEAENGKCRLTLIGEQIVKGKMTFVDAMRMQLQRYQYPSATSWGGRGEISHTFKVHPFQFLMRLLRDADLEGWLSVSELQYIVIFQATSDSKSCFNRVKKEILNYRSSHLLSGEMEKFNEETGADKIKNATGTEKKRLLDLKKEKNRYYDIANTLINYLAMTQYIDHGDMFVRIRKGKEVAVDGFIQVRSKYIRYPELEENYIRSYGRGVADKDQREFDNVSDAKSLTERTEARIAQEYVLLALRTPITSITEDVVSSINESTGIDEKVIEKYLVQNYPHGNIDDFFLAYKEMAHMGRAQATEFELATVELFQKIFHMHAKHLGQMGKTAAPDVFIESDSGRYSGIIDNKAYKNGYSIRGANRRVMEDEYIPHALDYCNGKYPLAFFTYIAGSFKNNIDGEIEKIHLDTGVNGSAMPVDIFIDMAQDYASKGWTHEDIRRVFSLNREIRLSDLEKN